MANGKIHVAAMLRAVCVELGAMVPSPQMARQPRVGQNTAVVIARVRGRGALTFIRQCEIIFPKNAIIQPRDRPIINIERVPYRHVSYAPNGEVSVENLLHFLTTLRWNGLRCGDGWSEHRK